MKRPGPRSSLRKTAVGVVGVVIVATGLVLFVLFFLVTVLFFVRLKLRALIITAPLFFVLLVLLSRRWRTLRRATEDVTRWLRRKLYVLPEQVR